MGKMIDGINLTELKIIPSDLGAIMHAMKCDDQGFAGFGEAYFSIINKGVIKGWKKHTLMISNIVVPVGIIRFVIFDERPYSHTKNNYFEVTLSKNNYQRLTVQPGLWMAFEGIGQGSSMLLNIGSIKHDSKEAETSPFENSRIKYPIKRNEE